MSRKDKQQIVALFVILDWDVDGRVGEVKSMLDEGGVVDVTDTVCCFLV